MSILPVSPSNLPQEMSPCEAFEVLHTVAPGGPFSPCCFMIDMLSELRDYVQELAREVHGYAVAAAPLVCLREDVLTRLRLIDTLLTLPFNPEWIPHLQEERVRLDAFALMEQALMAQARMQDEPAAPSTRARKGKTRARVPAPVATAAAD